MYQLKIIVSSIANFYDVFIHLLVFSIMMVYNVQNNFGEDLHLYKEKCIGR